MEETSELMLKKESGEMSSNEERKPKSVGSNGEEKTEDNTGLFSGKVVALLCLIYWVYICLGGVIYHFIETPQETTAVNNSVAKLVSFLENNTCVSPEDLMVFVQDVIEAYDAGITISNDTESHDTSWDIASSIFFCTTIVSTIGYGNIAPSGPGGRVFTVFFALFGIPLFVIVSGQLGMRFSRGCNKLTAKMLKQVKTEQWKSTLSLLIIFSIGFTLFMLIAAVIFFVSEEWTYADSLYYTFITLTTIGLGDYVPGFANGLEQRSAGAIFYRLFVSIWIIFGLVWMASTISAISDALENFVNSRKTKPDYKPDGSSDGTPAKMKSEEAANQNEPKESTNL